MKNYGNLYRKRIFLLFLGSQMVDRKQRWNIRILSAPYKSSMKSSVLLVYLSILSSGHSWITLLCLPCYPWSSLDEIPVFYVLCEGTDEIKRETDPRTPLVLRISNFNQLSTWYIYLFNKVLLNQSVCICVWIHQIFKDE